MQWNQAKDKTFAAMINIRNPLYPIVLKILQDAPRDGLHPWEVKRLTPKDTTAQEVSAALYQLKKNEKIIKSEKKHYSNGFRWMTRPGGKDCLNELANQFYKDMERIKL